MVDDPYKVLGVARDASMDEVKKAYRKMAKLYHPDMHPNDPNASKKMNEINEAYDMVMNPEKYAKARAQQQQQQQRQYYGGGYSGYGGYQQQAGGSSGGQQGYGEYGGFDFNDFFGGYQTTIPKPQAMSTDSAAVRQAIIAINNDHFQNAVNILNNIVSAERNARWYYLFALANHGAGNRVAAWENIQRAASIEPNNREYQNAKRVIGQDAQEYQSAGRGFNMDARGTVGLCAGLCVMQLCCRMSLCGC